MGRNWSRAATRQMSSPVLPRATERIIGPWGTFNFGPLAYHCNVMLCCMKALVLLQKGVGGSLPEKTKENGAILCISVTQNGL